MVTFLFWNINRREIAETVTLLAEEQAPDLFVLAECPDEVANKVLHSMNEVGPARPARYSLLSDTSDTPPRLKIFSKLSPRNLKLFEETRYWTIRRFTRFRNPELLLVIVHMPSLQNRKPTDIDSALKELARKIRSAEAAVQHSRTILIGDLNANPFQHGVVSADGLHAVMTKSIAQRSCRTVEQKLYPFFYNPMWKFFGDGSAGPPGTYYYLSSVGVRSVLLEHFRPSYGASGLAEWV